MTYPKLPMALVTFLAGVSKERSGLPTDATNVTIVAHKGETTRSRRYAVRRQEHWNEVEIGAVTMFGEGPVDTMTMIYPTDDAKTDAGIILERGTDPLCFEWTHAPAFSIRLVNTEMQEKLAGGVAVDNLRKLLAITPWTPAPPTPAESPALVAPQYRN